MDGRLTRLIVLKALGMAICVLPVTAAILYYFPLWIGGGGTKALSGFAVLLCAIAHVPLMRGLKRIFESSSSFAMWLCIFIIFLLLSEIADEMTVIAFYGFISNALGAVVLKIADRYREGTDESKL